MSADLGIPLHPQPHATNRRIKMADGTKIGVVWEVSKVVITVVDLSCQMTFLVVSSASFCFIMGRPTMRQMKASLNLEKDIAVFRREGSTVDLPL